MRAVAARLVFVGGLLVWLAGMEPSSAGAQGLIGAGAKDVGLGAGLSVSHETHPGTHSVTGVQVLGHAGYVVTDETGPGWLRGNLELLLEPTLIHLNGGGDSATVGGASALVRWIFAGTGTLRPFLEAGAGVVAGQMDFRQTNCDVNFILEGGPGLLVFMTPRVALTAGYRFQHISNADRCSQNLGLNSSLVHVGVSYFFP